MRPQKRASASQYRLQILEAVFDFLFETGAANSELRSEISNALRKCEIGRPKNPEQMRVKIAEVGCLLHRWHNDLKYLDESAMPIPLRARGRARSFEALVRAEKIRVPYARLLYEMKALRLIKYTRTGYLPTRRDAIISRRTATSVNYAAHAIRRMLATITNNLDASRRISLVERAAFVPDFPAHRLEEFSEFTKRQGSVMTSTINDWLEARRSPQSLKKKGQRLHAGVHIFAFSVHPPVR